MVIANRLGEIGLGSFANRWPGEERGWLMGQVTVVERIVVVALLAGGGCISPVSGAKGLRECGPTAEITRVLAAAMAGY